MQAKNMQFGIRALRQTGPAQERPNRQQTNRQHNPKAIIKPGCYLP
jgi:hypothetical protein